MSIVSFRLLFLIWWSDNAKLKGKHFLFYLFKKRNKNIICVNNSYTCHKFISLRHPFHSLFNPQNSDVILGSMVNYKRRLELLCFSSVLKYYIKVHGCLSLFFYGFVLCLFWKQVGTADPLAATFIIKMLIRYLMWERLCVVQVHVSVHYCVTLGHYILC